MNGKWKTILPLGIAAAFSWGCADAQIVVIVNAKNAASSMSREQVAAYFLGKATDLRPIELAEGSVVRGEFYRRVLDRDATQVRAVWAKLIFTENGRVPREGKSSAEVKAVVASEADAIGYLNAGEVDQSVKVVYEVR